MTDVPHIAGFDGMSWLNEPLSAERAGDALTVRTRRATDFWHETFYGFRRHSGHFLRRCRCGRGAFGE